MANLFINKNIDDFYGEEFAEFLLTEAGGRELREGDFPIVVLIHLGECRLGDEILGGDAGILGLHQAVHVLDQPSELLLRDRAIAVNVEHSATSTGLYRSCALNLVHLVWFGNVWKGQFSFGKFRLDFPKHKKR